MCVCVCMCVMCVCVYVVCMCEGMEEEGDEGEEEGDEGDEGEGKTLFCDFKGPAWWIPELVIVTRGSDDKHDELLRFPSRCSR